MTITAGQTACQRHDTRVVICNNGGTTKAAPAGNRGLTTDWIGVEMAVSKRTRFEVLRRDNYTCRYCRATEAPLTVDHVTPVALGGTDNPDNLVAACRESRLLKRMRDHDCELERILTPPASWFEVALDG